MDGIFLLLLAALLSAAPARPTPSTQPEIAEKTSALLERWKARFDDEGFSYLASPPFVVAGDGSMRQLQQYRDRTILSAKRALQSMYFEKQPGQPILILLFESEEPYKRLAKKWFGNDDVPHFGYFRPDGIMLMNVATGTGTLVHELVHALLQPDFPDVPTWFNEGLASLYEQSAINGASIRGLANWRLPGLQQAIKQKKLRPLKEMIEDPDFRSDERVGINYAQARYLMMYLQELNKLKQFYQEARDHRATDPRAIKALESVIAPKQLAEFDAEWRQWVMTLRFE
jgi:hypothetical protein